MLRIRPLIAIIWIGYLGALPPGEDDPRRSQEPAPAPTASKQPNRDGQPDPNQLTYDRIIELHNKYRAEEKLASLTVSRKLQAAALAHARDMAGMNKMTHTGSDGSNCAERVTAQGYRFRRVGENVAVGRFTAERVMKGWMNSPPHRSNILGSFSQIGVACAIAEDGKRYWCVNFGLPARR
jgi:uncharacterized protein YkwD